MLVVAVAVSAVVRGVTVVVAAVVVVAAAVIVVVVLRDAHNDLKP